MSVVLGSELIELAGGKVDGLVVSRPAITLLSGETGITRKGREIIEYYVNERGMEDSASIEDKLIDFANRITYLSFYAKKTTQEFLGVLKDLGHNGFFYHHSHVVLIAGVSQECVLELISNSRNNSCRMTSSNTKRAIDTLYSKNVDIGFLEKFIAMRDMFIVDNPGMKLEFLNQHNLSTKVGYLVMSMSLDDWDCVSKSRIHDNCESEVTEVMVKCRKILGLRPV